MPKIEKRIDLPGSQRTLPPGSRKIGPCDPQEQIQVTVFLRRGGSPKQFPDLTKIGKIPPAQRKHLTPAQFASRHGARPGDLKKIRVFAAQNKLKVEEVSRPRRSVLLSGSVSAFSRAFGVELNTYQHSTGTSRMRSGSIQIPAGLSGIVEGVFGLDNRPQAKPHFRIRKRLQDAAGANAASTSYNAPQVAQAYDFPANSTGSGQTIGILELSGGYSASDLATYFKNLGIATPTVTAVSVDGATNSPTGDPNGADGEVELDIEVSGAVAPSAQIAVYFSPNTDQGFIDALTTAVHDTKLNPAVVSISWGGPESSWTQQALTSFNSACEDASTIGVTILVASGDDGSTDGASSGTPTVDFPASSPYVLACGGTKLTLSGTKISNEQAWNELSSNEGATGGGVSEFFALPSYQQSAGVPKAPNSFEGRGVPDVSGDADPETGYNVLVDGQQTVIGGTSAVAPLWAALLARINQSVGKNVGYLNPLLYTTNVGATLHDITVGNNGTYSAGPGWDACTGLGTPNGAALLAALSSPTTPTKKKKKKSPTKRKAAGAKHRRKP